MRLLIVAFCLTFITTIGATYAIVEESDAPFIYYFSPTERAIIIERADGADRRVLQHEMFASEGIQVQDLHWSPSGKWLVWWIGLYNDESQIERSETWAIRSDFSELKKLEDQFVGWSPTTDMYLKVERSGQQTIASIIDLETLYPLLTFDVNRAIGDFRWSSNGQHIFFSAPVESGENLRTFFVQSLNGERSERTVWDNTNGYSWESSLSVANSFLLYIHSERHTLILENFETGTVYDIGNVSHINTSNVRWSPNAQYATIVSRNEGLSVESQILLVSVSNPEMYVINEAATPPTNVVWSPQSDSFVWQDAAYVGYFYSGVQLYHIGFEDDGLKIEDIYATTDAYAEYTYDGNGVYFVTQSQITVFDISRQQIVAELEGLHDLPRRQSYNGDFIAGIAEYSSGNDYKFIEDRLTKARYEFPIHSQLPASQYPYSDGLGITWHVNSEWVQFLEYFWGDFDDCFISFAHTSGLVYRELDDWFVCDRDNQNSYPRWLPDNVPLDDIR